MSAGVTRCPVCGAYQSDAHRYCSECGSMLRHEGHHDATGPMPLPPEIGTGEWTTPHADGPTLAVMQGGPTGVLFPVPEGVVTIGRSPSSDVFLDDVTVSRRHALLTRREGGFVVEDQGSLNGTFVNRRRVDVKELEDGDEVQVGKYKLTFLER